MTLGPIVFLAPWALAGLALLPAIWWVLRATPPAPRRAELPSLRLLDTVADQEETPARTPWWLLALRLAAAALASLGLAQPVYEPGPRPGDAPALEGPLLVVLDDGWTAAPRWQDLTRAVRAELQRIDRDTGVHLLRTAHDDAANGPGIRRTRDEIDRQVASLSPVPWEVDRAAALARLEASDLAPGRILYASDGLDRPDRQGLDGAGFAAALADRAPLTVFAAPPRGIAALTGLDSTADGIAVRAIRPEGARALGAETAREPFVTARTLDGDALASAPVEFEDGAPEGSARFSLPAAALSRINRFEVTDARGAGLVWLWDSAARQRRVAVIAGQQEGQPLLSDTHYVRQALAPFASLLETDLAGAIAAEPDAIILADFGALLPADRDALDAWIRGGGVLIRFAGPKMAASNNRLVPTPLRPASRAFGGALAWDQPQTLAAFPETSPFADLRPPADAVVRRQVLAQPAPDLAGKTWARLEDGSPLVTAERRDRGAVILFHVTAGPDWSDLPYTGAFAEMLRRSIAAGQGGTERNGRGTYVPERVLDGFGTLTPPGAEAAPLAAEDIAGTRPSPTHPPGLYRGPAGTRALNAAAGAALADITDWPASATLMGDAATRRMGFAGGLLAAALALLAIDLALALALAGRLRRRSPPGTGASPGRADRRAVRTAAALIGGLILLPLLEPAQAQSSAPGTRASPDRSPALSKEAQAATNMRFAYIETGDAERDARTRAGLQGLSRVLYLRTSVEPADPHGVDPATDALVLYPLVYYAVPEDGAPLNEAAIAGLNAYLRAGGALVIDTARGGDPSARGDPAFLSDRLTGLDTPPLGPVPDDHVLTKSFYLIDGFPGRYDTGRLWIDSSGAGGDGVAGLFVGDNDWIGAWAVDERSRPRFSVDGGERQREMAFRFGINLVMYVLTGNYKADQVHIPALLERLGARDGPPGTAEDGRNDEPAFDLDRLPRSLQDGGPR